MCTKKNHIKERLDQDRATRKWELAGYKLWMEYILIQLETSAAATVATTGMIDKDSCKRTMLELNGSIYTIREIIVNTQGLKFFCSYQLVLWTLMLLVKKFKNSLNKYL